MELTEEDRARATECYHNWQLSGHTETYQDEPEFCYSASLEEIRQKGYTLVPSRYIKFINHDEDVDFDSKMRELHGQLTQLLAEEEVTKQGVLNVFKELGYEIEL